MGSRSTVAAGSPAVFPGVRCCAKLAPEFLGFRGNGNYLTQKNKIPHNFGAVSAEIMVCGSTCQTAISCSSTSTTGTNSACIAARFGCSVINNSWNSSPRSAHAAETTSRAASHKWQLGLVINCTRGTATTSCYDAERGFCAAICDASSLPFACGAS